MMPISIHAPHTGRDSPPAGVRPRNYRFQSTRPIRGATAQGLQVAPIREHFNPRAPYGARPHVDTLLLYVQAISIHAPHTGRDPGFLNFPLILSNFNPRAPYGARLMDSPDVSRAALISIHAPHTGRDRPRQADQQRECISIHAPHTGRDFRTTRR